RTRPATSLEASIDSPAMAPRYVAVCGQGAPDPEHERNAREVGRLLARAGAGVLCGGRPEGVMEAVSEGVQEAGGTVIGILPGRPLLEQWVTIAPWRQERTYHPAAADCPLCPTRPGGMETEVPEPDYHIAVFENRFPAYAGDQGRSEVVLYTPEHDSSLGAQPLDQIRDLIEVWQDRLRDLSALPNVRYVFIFENRGEQIGVT